MPELSFKPSVVSPSTMVIENNTVEEATRIILDMCFMRRLIKSKYRRVNKNAVEQERKI